MSAQGTESAAQVNTRYDHAVRRRSQRRGRERGCWVYIPAEELEAAGLASADDPPFYRIWHGERGRFVVTLYATERPAAR